MTVGRRHPPMTEAERSMVAAALAEAGYPDALVRIEPHPDDGTPTLNVDWTVPHDVVWRAYTLLDRWGALACFACWVEGNRTRVTQPCEARGLALGDCGYSSERAS